MSQAYEHQNWNVQGILKLQPPVFLDSADPFYVVSHYSAWHLQQLYGMKYTALRSLLLDILLDQVTVLYLAFFLQQDELF